MGESLEEIVISQESSCFFDELISFVLMVSSLAPSIELQNDRKTTKWLPTQYIVFEPGRAFRDFQIRVYPYEIINLISRNIWPNKFVIIKEPFVHIVHDQPVSISCIQKVHGTIIQSTFSQYYENVKSAIEEKFGKEVESWPTVWNFARLVRNAFSHGGRIKISNPKTPKIIWRELEYDYFSNGKSIMYSDLTAVELIFLMIEMDSHLM